MKTFKLAIQGTRVVEIEANSIDDVYNDFWESEAHENSDMFNTEILEVVNVNEDFNQNSDLN